MNKTPIAGFGDFSSVRVIHPEDDQHENEILIQAQRGARAVINKTDGNVQRLRESILKSLTEHEKAVLVTLPADKRRALIKKYVEVSIEDGKYSSIGFDVSNAHYLQCDTCKDMNANLVIPLYAL